MGQTNLAYDDLSHSQQVFSPQPAEELRRSPEQQAEFERLGSADTYLVLDSDEELFKWLDDQRDRKICGYVTASEGAGLHKVCKYYQVERVRQRRGKFLLPVSVIYSEVKQHGGPLDLYGAILEVCSHPLAHVDPLKDRRKRTKQTFRDYGTKNLIVGNADYLTLESFNELIDLSKDQQLSVILVGTPYLEQILERNSLPYQRVYNSFLESYEFPLLWKKDVTEIVEDWEEVFLPEERRLNLASIAEMVDFLLQKSGKLREPLYDIIRHIATLRLDEPGLDLTKKNLTKCLAKRKAPKTRLFKKEAS
ncbi:ATP-binding protein [Leptolyngbya sp. FACHB-321]|uniref:ATP-binding protein n=1 Tax=Leptolyngbya sp. FACHB-321 TaxID=2692807 RepID=UPI001689DE9D|nr:ATP-binding protein [Leptolyngbya sp. FACHB-321]MBD2035512.1 ATP-binding protein [Leptolyngbya sp. FACHB-321]